MSTLPADLRARAEGWAERWGLPDLLDHVSFDFNDRFRTTLGRCIPNLGQVRLASFLLEQDPELLAEALCHELAHVAVYRLHGFVDPPHGPEWKRLVARAGFFPRTRAQMGATARRLIRVPMRARWEHRCPVCQIVRIGGRPVPEWRCADCLDAGLSGEMVITRIPPPDESPR